MAIKIKKEEREKELRKLEKDKLDDIKEEREMLDSEVQYKRDEFHRRNK